MKEKQQKICPVCGILFRPKSPRDKYCSDKCRKAGQKALRKAWEKKTGYLEKQRQRMAAYRETTGLQKRKEQEKAAQEAARIRNAEDLQREKKLHSAQVRAAKHGDTSASLALAAEAGRNCSLEYWDAWQEYELQWCAAAHKISLAEVNSISVHDPDFSFKVILSIEELNSITVKTGSKEAE